MSGQVLHSLSILNKRCALQSEAKTLKTRSWSDRGLESESPRARREKGEVCVAISDLPSKVRPLHKVLRGTRQLNNRVLWKRRKNILKKSIDGLDEGERNLPGGTVSKAGGRAGAGHLLPFALRWCGRWRLQATVPLTLESGRRPWGNARWPPCPQKRRGSRAGPRAHRSPRPRGPSHRHRVGFQTPHPHVATFTMASNTWFWGLFTIQVRTERTTGHHSGWDATGRPGEPQLRAGSGGAMLGRRVHVTAAVLA